jgi:hypothetical protein
MAKPPKTTEPNQEVGRGRPPQHTRFVKGISGNPKGRPRKTRDLKALLEEELDRPVSLLENGKRVRLTKREVMVKNLVNDAAKSDPKARQIVFGLLGGSSEPDNPVVRIEPAELARFTRRYLPKGGEDAE